MTTGIAIALIRQTFVGKVISLLFNVLSHSSEGRSSEIHNDGAVIMAVPMTLTEHLVVLDNSTILRKMFKP